MIAPQQLDALDPQQMRQALLTSMAQVATKGELLAHHGREIMALRKSINHFKQSTDMSVVAGRPVEI